MINLNRVILTGMLTSGIELKKSATGKKFAILQLCQHDNLESNKMLVIDVIVWGNLAENCAKYLSLGAHIMLEGRIENDRYFDSNHKKQTITRICASSITFIEKNNKGETTMNNRYFELKTKHQREINAFPVGFAFGKAQQAELLAKWHLNSFESVTSLGGGMFIQDKDLPAWRELIKRINHELADSMLDDDFFRDAVIYELGNYEFGENMDGTAEVLEALGFRQVNKDLDMNDSQAYNLSKKQLDIFDQEVRHYWDTYTGE